MTDYRPSIVAYSSRRNKGRCGYCKTTDGSYTYDLHAHSLTVEDYQEMIDRGWRRCGHYCYKSIMNETCCPYYTIRCAAKDFKLSRSQKKVLKRFNHFLSSGEIGKNKVFKNTEIEQPMDTYVRANSIQIDESQLNVPVIPLTTSDGDKNFQNTASKEEKKNITAQPEKSNLSLAKGETKKKCSKAKYLRIERKRQKLQKLGLSEEEIAKKMVEKKRYPVVKTLEDYINESLLKSKAHNLEIFLVRSSPQSEEFKNTFAASFALYKRYQMFVHKSPLTKLTSDQYERFLVESPLQTKIVLVQSLEFNKTFEESALLFKKYQKAVHHESDEDHDFIAFNDFLVSSPLKASNRYGSYHQQYWLDDKLIAVGVIDILPKCVTSVYFFYDPDYASLSLGIYGALREIELTRKLSKKSPDLIYYYMGFYIHSCPKMRYKATFKPSFLLCPEVYTWHSISDCLPKIEICKYSRLNEDPSATDTNSSITDVSILCDGYAMPLRYYLNLKKCEKEEREEIMEYGRLIGRSCAKNYLDLCRGYQAHFTFNFIAKIRWGSHNIYKLRLSSGDDSIVMISLIKNF